MSAICGACGKEMKFNVPRIGPAGGYVHAETGKLSCGEQMDHGQLLSQAYDIRKEVSRMSAQQKAQLEAQAHGQPEDVKPHSANAQG